MLVVGDARGEVVSIPALRNMKCVQWRWGSGLEVAAGFGDFSEFGIVESDPAKKGDRITTLLGQTLLDQLYDHFEPSVAREFDPQPIDFEFATPAKKIHLRLETVLEISTDGELSLFSYWRNITSLKNSQNQAKLLQQVVNSIPSWIFVKNTDHNYEMVNSAYASFYGATPNECVGKNSIDLGVGEEIAKGCEEKGIVGFWADDDQVFESAEPKEILCEPIVVENQTRFLQTLKTPIQDPGSGDPLLVGFCHDITYLKHIETQMGIELRHNKTLNDIGKILDGYNDFDEDAQAAVCQFLVTILDCRDVRIDLTEPAPRVGGNGGGNGDGNFHYRVPIEFKANRLGILLVQTKNSDDGPDDAVEALLVAVADKLAAHAHGQNLLAEINHYAQHDSLTGLPNRHFFTSELNKAVAQAKQGHGNCAVALMDLDGFKRVNDSLGHHVGDKLLVAVAKRLKAVSRSNEMLARLGGDEFAILLNGLSNREEGAIAAQRYLDAIQQPFTVDGRSLTVGASFGISVHDVQSTKGSVILQQADAAMYFAKASGRNNCQKFNQSIADKNNSRLHCEHVLREALKNVGELYLLYQPKIDLRTNQVTGVEALVRCHSSEHGLLMPSEFISVAEESGLILPLGEWIMKSALSTVARWNEELANPIQLSINVTPPELEQVDFADQLMLVLDESGLDPECLDLELTETFMMNRFEEVSQRLRDIRSKGIQISIDDFGAGYSCMKYLQHMPIDCLKIDRSFVTMLDFPPEQYQPKRLAIAEAIIGLAKSIGLRTVAEGIETQNQLRHVVALGADLGQGYLFSKPLTKYRALELLRQQQNHK